MKALSAGEALTGLPITANRTGLCFTARFSTPRALRVASRSFEC